MLIYVEHLIYICNLLRTSSTSVYLNHKFYTMLSQSHRLLTWRTKHLLSLFMGKKNRYRSRWIIINCQCRFEYHPPYSTKENPTSLFSSVCRRYPECNLYTSIALEDSYTNIENIYLICVVVRDIWYLVLDIRSAVGSRRTWKNV